jgi:hypothetical protein
MPGDYTVAIDIPAFPLLPGVYSVRVGVEIGKVARNIFYEENILHFQVKNSIEERTQSMSEGFISLNGTWRLLNSQGENQCIGD